MYLLRAIAQVLHASVTHCSMQAPSSDVIYRTLRNNQQILSVYKQRVDRISSQMTSLHLSDVRAQLGGGAGVEDDVSRQMNVQLK